MLPDEVWEIILEKIDYYDLKKLKMVSKRWDELITLVIVRKYKWYEKCLEEVPEKWWSSLLELQTHPEICCDDFHKARKHSSIWMSMYRSWIGWSSLTKNRSQQIIRLFDSSEEDSLPSEDKQIVCLAVSSNIVAIGNTGKRVIAYDISKPCGKPIYKQDRITEVNDIQLWRKGMDVTAVSHSCYSVYYSDVTTKKQDDRHFDSMDDILIRTSFDYCYTVWRTPFGNNDVDDVRYWNILFGEGSEHYNMKVERLSSETTSKTLVIHGLDTSAYVHAMTADGGKAIFVASNILGGGFDDDPDDDTTVYVYEILPDRQLKHLSNFFQRDEDSFFLIDIFKPCVVAFVEGSTRSEREQIGFVISGRTCIRYDCQLDVGLNSHVTAIHYHVGLLMLGLASGEVRIFNVENDDCLGTLNFEILESMTLKLTRYNIEHIKITEYNSIQYLVVAAVRELILVKFD